MKCSLQQRASRNKNTQLRASGFWVPMHQTCLLGRTGGRTTSSPLVQAGVSALLGRMPSAVLSRVAPQTGSSRDRSDTPHVDWSRRVNPPGGVEVQGRPHGVALPQQCVLQLPPPLRPHHTRFALCSNTRCCLLHLLCFLRPLLLLHSRLCTP